MSPVAHTEVEQCFDSGEHKVSQLWMVEKPVETDTDTVDQVVRAGLWRFRRSG